MAIQSVRQLCDVSDIVSKDGLVDQIANLDDLHKGRIDPDAFFRRNHFTEGLNALVRNGFDRLSGRSGDGAFYCPSSDDLRRLEALRNGGSGPSVLRG